MDNAESLGVKPTDMTNLAVTSEYRSAHNQVTHVNLGQRRTGSGLHRPRDDQRQSRQSRGVRRREPRARDQRPRAGAELDAVEAVEAAADELALDAPQGLKVLEANRRASLLSTGGISAEPIPAKLGYQPTKDGLRLAWQVTIDDVEDGHLYEATVDAASGELLEQERLDLAREDAEPGQRRVELPHLRVPEAGPERR